MGERSSYEKFMCKCKCKIRLRKRWIVHNNLLLGQQHQCSFDCDFFQKSGRLSGQLFLFCIQQITSADWLRKSRLLGHHCYIAILLHCYFATLLHCYIATLLHCYIAIFLHCYIAKFLLQQVTLADWLRKSRLLGHHCYIATLLHCCVAILLHFYFNRSHCWLDQKIKVAWPPLLHCCIAT